MSQPTVEGLKPHKDEWTGNLTIDEFSGDSINPQTIASPAVANFSGALLFTYRGIDENRIFQCLYSENENKVGSWSQNSAISVDAHNIGTSDGPSLAVFNGTLYMAYRASAKNNGDYPIMLATLTAGLTDPSDWAGDTAISIGGKYLNTDHAPSLTVQGSGAAARLWLGWQKDSDIYTATFDGKTWTNNGQIKDIASNGTPSSNYGPALCGYGNSVWVIFKGRHSNHLMWAAYNAVTNLWSGNLDIEDKRGIMKKPESNLPPGIAAFDDCMYIVYKGEDSNELRQAVLSDQAWSGNNKIYDSSDINPVTDAVPALAAMVQGKNTVLVMANKGVGASGSGAQIYMSELK